MAKKKSNRKEKYKKFLDGKDKRIALRMNTKEYDTDNETRNASEKNINKFFRRRK